MFELQPQRQQFDRSTARPDSAPGAHARTRGSTPPKPSRPASLLGYRVHEKPENAEEYGSYTNVVLDRGWPDYGEGLIIEVA